MEWLSEWFDKIGRDFNRTYKGEEAECAKAAATGIVSLRDGNYTVIPEYVFKHGDRVRVFDATNNRIQSLPDKFSSFLVLSKLHLAHNQLTELPTSILLSTITTLNLEHNRLTTLPDAIGKLIRLRKLELHHNPLKELPPSVGDLQSLEYLDMSHCNLFHDGAKKIDLGIVGRCLALVELRLDNNSLQTIPESLCNLKRLKILTLDNNLIENVPNSLFMGCTQLQKLSLLGTKVVVEHIQKVPGYDEYEMRRQGKHTKQIAGNVLIDSKGFEDGLDRVMQ
mmetsp:Transcript_2898/g.5466  ORF Transcript_2898/g.5466 Transcript_2898/m.5466 type:complete len:280 (-) Transcript_2898:191-1030(-)